VVRKTIVFVTHDIEEAIKLGDRVALLQRGGVLAQYATPAELLAHPASEFVAGFLGENRMVRRLGLIRLADVPLARLDGAAPPQERIADAATLRDALDAVLRSPDGRVGVMRGGEVVGVVDVEAIRRAAAQ
jgi:osmoprotectant transport system ATP-binding protein